MRRQTLSRHSERIPYGRSLPQPIPPPIAQRSQWILRRPNGSRTQTHCQRPSNDVAPLTEAIGSATSSQPAVTLTDSGNGCSGGDVTVNATIDDPVNNGPGDDPNLKDWSYAIGDAAPVTQAITGEPVSAEESFVVPRPIFRRMASRLRCRERTQMARGRHRHCSRVGVLGLIRFPRSAMSRIRLSLSKGSDSVQLLPVIRVFTENDDSPFAQVVDTREGREEWEAGGYEADSSPDP